MKRLLFLIIISGTIFKTHALLISEIMSNPTGIDDGREWIEIYNNDTSAVDLSSLTLSIKNSTPVGIISMQGGTSLQPNTYAIIGSIVSNNLPQNNFLSDYTYNGILLKVVKSISLVNTGVTSLDIRLNGNVIDTLSSYTPASEGKTLSLINGVFVKDTPPTPGDINQEPTPDTNSSSNSTSTNNQMVVTQMSAPTADIILYVPFDKIVVAGADTEFTASGMTRSGNITNGLNCNWAFGDGGVGTGTTTMYAYAYSGYYLTKVECGNGSVLGYGIMHTRVITPDVSISSFGTGKYGTYIDINNPNNYDLDFSQWRLNISDSVFPFPKNTILSKNSTTRISGRAMGFASTTVSTSTMMRITFPNSEEVTRNKVQDYDKIESLAIISIQNLSTSSLIVSQNKSEMKKSISKQNIYITQQITSKLSPSTSTPQIVPIKSSKDTRLVSWFKSLFNW